MIRILESVFQGLKQLFSHKLRSGLTLLGIFIGIAAIIGTSTLLDAVNRMVVKSFEQFGQITVMGIEASWGEYRDGRWIWHDKQYPLTPDDANALKEAFPIIKEIAVQTHRGGTVQSGGNSFRGVSVLGVSETFAKLNNLNISEGAFLSERDINEWSRSAVLSAKLREDMFGEENPVGEEILIEGHRFNVVGVMNPRGSSTKTERARVYIPYTTARNRVYGVSPWDGGVSVLMQFGSEQDLQSATKLEILKTSLRNYLTLRHPGATPAHFETWSLGEWQSDVLDNIKTQFYILYGVAILCLITGGIGIMNIMMVSVSERTREIGLRKAIGAKNRDILMQFLIEAIVLSLVGGLAGIAGGWLVGHGFSSVLKNTMDDPTYLEITIKFSTVILALGTAAGVAVLFGIFPALKASRLNPIESLRYE